MNRDVDSTSLGLRPERVSLSQRHGATDAAVDEHFSSASRRALRDNAARAFRFNLTGEI
jgi:hypothetical protein